jgi:hypothetical protein
MNEVFPVLAGVVIGLATCATRPVWLRVALIAVLGIGLGAVASWVSGELAMSWVYALIDTGQVLAASIMTGVLVRAWLRRRARPLARG